MEAKVGDSAQTRVMAATAEDVPMSTTVIEAIAELESTRPMALDVTLYDAIDLDALDSLCTASSGGVEVSFTVDDYDIEVRADDTVVVERR